MVTQIPFNQYAFHPVVALPANYVVLDLSNQSDANTKTFTSSQYTIGRYNEKRTGMYTQALFGHDRDIHVGIDIGTPPGEAVKAFYAGEIFLFGDNSAPGDYGPTIVTRHDFDGTPLFALYGHLSRSSLSGKFVGQEFAAGDTLGQVGNQTENGGWPPHLHFQLSNLAPSQPDFPGVVSAADLEQALLTYPDPRLVLGKIY